MQGWTEVDWVRVKSSQSKSRLNWFDMGPNWVK